MARCLSSRGEQCSSVILPTGDVAHHVDAVSGPEVEGVRDPTRDDSLRTTGDAHAHDFHVWKLLRGLPLTQTTVLTAWSNPRSAPLTGSLAQRAAHHDDLDGDRNRQLGSEPVVELLDDEHDRHDDQRNHDVAHVAAGDLREDALQGLEGRFKERRVITLAGGSLISSSFLSEGAEVLLPLHATTWLHCCLYLCWFF